LLIVDCSSRQVPVRDRMPRTKLGNMIAEHRIGRSKTTSLSVAESEYQSQLTLAPNSPQTLHNQFAAINNSPYVYDWTLINWETYNAVIWRDAPDSPPAAVSPGPGVPTLREDDALALANFHRVVREQIPGASICSYRLFAYKNPGEPGAQTAAGYWDIYKSGLENTNAANFPGGRTTPVLPTALLVSGYLYAAAEYNNMSLWRDRMAANVAIVQATEPDIPVMLITSPRMYGTAPVTGLMPMMHWDIVCDFCMDNGFGNLVWYQPDDDFTSRPYLKRAVDRATIRRATA